MSARLRSARRPEKLLLLVGSNPLPNYLAAIVLDPAEVVLLYSPQTEGPCRHLKTALEKKGIGVSERCIDDATDAREIRDACQSLQVDHLHYSGGTKPMAAHAHAACNLKEAQASYLDERNGRLRFDDGSFVALGDYDLDLTLDLVLALHGVEGSSQKKAVEGGPTENDVAAIRDRALKEPAFPQSLYDHFRPGGKRRNVTRAKADPWKPADHDLTLSVTSVPDADWRDPRYTLWEKFLTGGWLECLVGGLIQSCEVGSAPIEIGVNCKRAQPIPRDFEIDVALIRGHRLYVVSCTTDTAPGLCKSKLFEVAMRARQMGGDLARSALVCLLDGGDNKGPYVDQLRNDIKSVWDAPNTPEVFGLDDLRAWSGLSGAADLGTLQQWLDS